MSADKKMSLKQAQAQNVWKFFRQINRIPRGSKNEKQIMDWLKGLAKRRNLTCRSDDVDNVIIELPATNGFEKKSETRKTTAFRRCTRFKNESASATFVPFCRGSK